MKTPRRYDLDVLRVLSVFAVFIHHVCMPFNGDGFHIMNATHSKVLDDIMVYFEQFRLPLLFLVSGVGTVYACKQYSWTHFIKQRSKRLLLPLVFGVLVIVPPQMYYENPSLYNSFWAGYFQIIEGLETNHLWFIELLFYISLGCIPLIGFLKSNKSKKIKEHIQAYTKRFGMLSWVVVLIVLRCSTKYYFPSDSKDLLNLSFSTYYGFFFVAGILLTHAESLWEHIANHRRQYLYTVCIVTTLFYTYYLVPKQWVAPYMPLALRWSLWYALGAMVSWSVILTAIGYAKTYVNTPSKWLAYCNEAVYPFYILHQTVIVALGYYIIQLESSILIKIILLFFSALLCIITIYTLLIYRIKILRILFGMKSTSVYQRPPKMTSNSQNYSNTTQIIEKSTQGHR
ncbi:MAG: hypothetical protein CL867_10375 [Cytophagaceae bacterium]|nr:hypothetical protein [Cytophagaceae bacterium]